MENSDKHANSAKHANSSAVGAEKIVKYLHKFGNEREKLITILHAIQSDMGYVPRELVFELSLGMKIPVAKIWEVLTFYHLFKLTPQGKHNVVICMGTACYLKGAAGILKAVEENLGIKSGETTADRIFHIDVARCIGACGIAPAVKIDDEVIGMATAEKVMGKIGEIRATEEANGH
jgi:NADH:ubiquinone oxidoreductase subunit E